MQAERCLIVIPAYNEEDNVARVIREIRANDVYYDLVIVDDGSTDQTAKRARAAGEQVLSLPFNLGSAGAVQTGFKLAVVQEYDYVVHFDADGQHDPRDIRPIIETLKRDGYDVVIGSRVLGSGAEDLSASKKLIIAFFCWLIRRSTGQVITDPTSGLRGLSRRAFAHYARMGSYPEDYPDADILLHMIRSGLRVTEIPANIRRRMAGRSQFVGLKGLYYVAKMLVSVTTVLTTRRRGVDRVEDNHFDLRVAPVHYGLPPTNCG